MLLCWAPLALLMFMSFHFTPRIVLLKLLYIEVNIVKARRYLERDGRHALQARGRGRSVAG